MISEAERAGLRQAAREAVAAWPPLPEDLREKLRALLDPDSPGTMSPASKPCHALSGELGYDPTPTGGHHAHHPHHHAGGEAAP